MLSKRSRKMTASSLTVFSKGGLYASTETSSKINQCNLSTICETLSTVSLSGGCTTIHHPINNQKNIQTPTNLLQCLLAVRRRVDPRSSPPLPPSTPPCHLPISTTTRLALTPTPMQTSSPTPQPTAITRKRRSTRHALPPQRLKRSPRRPLRRLRRLATPTGLHFPLEPYLEAAEDREATRPTRT